MNIGQRSVAGFLVQIEQQEIGDGKVIQLIRDCWMPANAVQRIAEDKGLPQMRRKEGLHSKMIARTEPVLFEHLRQKRNHREDGGHTLHTVPGRLEAAAQRRSLLAPRIRRARAVSRSGLCI